MKNFVSKSLLALIMLSSVYFTACTRVSPGHVGIVVKQAGDDKGVLNAPVATGWQFYNPLSTSIFEYPTFVQTVQWTRDTSEGHPLNEEFTFAAGGIPVAADVSLSYQLESPKVPQFYVKFRITDMDQFTHGMLRNVARSIVNDEASKYTVEDLYLHGKSTEMMSHVKDRVNAQTNLWGIQVIQMDFINKIRPPQQFIDAILASAKATVDAQRVQNELAISQAEAAKKVADATGDANSQIARAKGEAEANQLRNSSLTPQALELKRLEIRRIIAEKWNGVQSRVVVSGNQLLSIDPEK